MFNNSNSDYAKERYNSSRNIVSPREDIYERKIVSKNYQSSENSYGKIVKCEEQRFLEDFKEKDSNLKTENIGDQEINLKLDSANQSKAKDLNKKDQDKSTQKKTTILNKKERSLSRKLPDSSKIHKKIFDETHSSIYNFEKVEDTTNLDSDSRSSLCLFESFDK